MKKSTYFAYAKDFVAFVGANIVTLYTSLLMEAQQKPEGLKRPQAGVKPLLKQMAKLAPKGRQSALPPFGTIFVITLRID